MFHVHSLVNASDYYIYYSSRTTYHIFKLQCAQNILYISKYKRDIKNIQKGRA